MYRERGSKVRLKYHEETDGKFYPAGSIVEIDWIGDPPGIMAVQWPVIAGTDHPLDWDEYETVGS